MRLAVLGILAVSAVFAAAPELTGNWKLSGAKSDFGPFPAPSAITQKITHAEPNLKVEVKVSSDMGDMEFTANYTTDGKESTYPGLGGSEAKSTAKWDGETLLMETKGAFGDTPYSMKDKWSVSEGGKVLTIVRHFSSAMGEADQKLVFDKQP
jgi:hypothetical protein